MLTTQRPRPVWLSILKWIGIIAIGQVIGTTVALASGVEGYGTMAGWAFFIVAIVVHKRNLKAALKVVPDAVDPRATAER